MNEMHALKKVLKSAAAILRVKCVEQEYKSFILRRNEDATDEQIAMANERMQSSLRLAAQHKIIDEALEAVYDCQKIPSSVVGMALGIALNLTKESDSEEIAEARKILSDWANEVAI